MNNLFVFNHKGLKHNINNKPDIKKLNNEVNIKKNNNLNTTSRKLFHSLETLKTISKNNNKLDKTIDINKRLGNRLSKNLMIDETQEKFIMSNDDNIDILKNSDNSFNKEIKQYNKEENKQIKYENINLNETHLYNNLCCNDIDTSNNLDMNDFFVDNIYLNIFHSLYKKDSYDTILEEIGILNNIYIKFLENRKHINNQDELEKINNVLQIIKYEIEKNVKKQDYNNYFIKEN